MLVSHLCKFIYIKTFKTAGTSVEMYFEPFCVEPGALRIQENKSAQVSAWGIVGSRGSADDPWYNHMPAAEVRARIGTEIWNSYHKFCVIRNPFDRLLSEFWYKLSPEQRHTLSVCPFDTVKTAFKSWLLGSNVGFERSIYLIDDRPALNSYIRYEALEEDIKSTCSLLGLPWQPKRLSHRKGGYRARAEHYTAYFDNAATRVVEECYAWELAAFGGESA